MSLLRMLSLIFGIFIVGAAGVWGLSPKDDDSGRRFEAHEFALFRSEYDTLRVQVAEKRVEHFRNLLGVTEVSHLTPGMAETLADFCRKVAASEEEDSTVQAEARLVVRTLEANQASRAPASDPSPK